MTPLSSLTAPYEKSQSEDGCLNNDKSFVRRHCWKSSQQKRGRNVLILADIDISVHLKHH